LGSFVTARLRDFGADVFIPTIDRYDLVQKESIQRMLDDAQPQLIIHLAAQVGGLAPTASTRLSFSIAT